VSRRRRIDDIAFEQQTKRAIETRGSYEPLELGIGQYCAKTCDGHAEAARLTGDTQVCERRKFQAAPNASALDRADSGSREIAQRLHGAVSVARKGNALFLGGADGFEF